MFYTSTKQNKSKFNANQLYTLEKNYLNKKYDHKVTELYRSIVHFTYSFPTKFLNNWIELTMRILINTNAAKIIWIHFFLKFSICG